MTDILQNFGWLDFLDITIVTLLIYRVILFLKGTRMPRLLVGLFLLLALYVIVELYGLATTHRILESFFSSLILIIVIIYQNEIRRSLFTFGRHRAGAEKSGADPQLIEELVTAADALVVKKVGALIVIERETEVDRFIEIGTEVDAKVTCELITSIFLPYSPIHDGAVIIQKGKLTKAGCFLPLTRNPLTSKSFGTRHRAAIGLTERTDAVVIVVSEETGKVSIVNDERVMYDVDRNTLRKTLKKLLEARQQRLL